MIYADYNATTPVDEEVISLLIRSLREDFGNPASHQHLFGQQAQASVDVARLQVAKALGTNPQGVIFTSGATESISIAVHGLLALNDLLPTHLRRSEVLVGANEHKAVLAAVEKWCKHFGCTHHEIPCLSTGELDLAWIRDNISERTVFVAVAGANNETGCINSVSEISEVAHNHGALVFSDMTQAFGKIRVDIGELGTDLIAVSSHKIYGPKGVGALVGNLKLVRRLPAMQSGGGQESGLRGGTLNVPGITGFGLASELAHDRIEEYSVRVGNLARKLEADLISSLPGVSINGCDAQRIPNTVNIRIADVDAEALLTRLDGIAISTGSACQSAVPAPSHVLVAMGLSHVEAREVIRISLGWHTTEDEVNEIVQQIIAAASDMRKLEG